MGWAIIGYDWSNKWFQQQPFGIQGLDLKTQSSTDKNLFGEDKRDVN